VVSTATGNHDMTEEKPTHWMGRNWKWFVPVGCLCVLAIAAAALVGFVFLLMSWVRGSEVYTLAMDKARSSPELVRALGEPITDGFITTGKVSTTGASGEADLQTYLMGPDGGGRLYIQARKQAGVWTFDTLLVRPEGDGGVIDLLDD